MNLIRVMLQHIATVPAWAFLLYMVLITCVFELAKVKYDRDDTISWQVYRWSLAFRLLGYIASFAFGFLTCHLFGV